MENKVLIRLIVPELDNAFDVFIPVNELIWKVTKLIVKSLSDLQGVNLDISKKYVMINQKNGKIYDNNEVIINTDIRNTSEIILLTNE